MSDYGAPRQFGLSVTPEAAHLEAISDLVQVADATGLDLIAIQDHAYNHTFVDTWTLMAFLAAKTNQVHFMPDVADLPLRPPPMMAKAVATLGRRCQAAHAATHWTSRRWVGQSTQYLYATR